jgi:hypothetical protein
MKAQANDIVALSGTSSTDQPLSADLLIGQAVHGIFPPNNPYIRPKDGDDICMLDLSGPIKDHLKFLPGLEASRFSPRSPKKDTSSKIAIDPETGAVILVENGVGAPRAKYAELEQLESETLEPCDTDIDSKGETYADVMASAGHGDEMELD